MYNIKYQVKEYRSYWLKMHSPPHYFMTYKGTVLQYDIFEKPMDFTFSGDTDTASYQ